MNQPSMVTSLTGPSAEEWQLHQTTTKRLYLEEDRRLPEVMKIMLKQHGFKASTKMYKTRLKMWKMDSKNLRKHEVKQIAHIMMLRDTAGKRSVFQTKGRHVNEQQVVRYVKKHGFSSVAEYVQDASPIVHNDDIRYYTPVASPRTPSDPLRSITAMKVGRKTLERLSATSSEKVLAKDCLLHRYLVPFSAEARPQRLLSPNSVPQSLSPPMVLTVPKPMFSSTNSTVQGDLDGKSLYLDSKGWLTSLKTPKAVPNEALSSLSRASRMIVQGQHVQASQLLSKVCATVEHRVQHDEAALLIELLNLFGTMPRRTLLDIQAINLGHCALSAKCLLGDKHPVTQLLHLLSTLDSSEGEFQLQFQVMRCDIDVLETRIGALYPATIYGRLSLVECINPTKAITQSKYSYADQTECFQAAYKLAEALCKNGQGPEARDILLRVLQDYDAPPPEVFEYPAKRVTLHMASHLLSIILFRMNDLAGAEQYSCRLCGTRVESRGRWSRSEERLFLDHRLTILRAMGRFREAGEVQGIIEDVATELGHRSF